MNQFNVIVAWLAVIISLATANSEPSEMRNVKRNNQTPAIFFDSKIQPSGRAGLEAGKYPSSNFLMYGTNCKFTGDDASGLYDITDVTDILTCGAQYCAGENKCSHFYIDGTTCKLMQSTAAISFAASANGLCGFFPVRACQSKIDNLSTFLNCITTFNQ